VRKGDAPVLLKKFEKKKVNTLFWAPQGQFLVMAFLKAAEGPLEFIDTSDFSTMNTVTPELTTDIAWDPTGRYVVGAVSAWTGKVSDTGFTVYSFQGRELRREKISRFGNLFWRPRPPCLLTHAQLKELKKNLKKYSPQFEEDDRKLHSKLTEEEMQRRKETVGAWKEYRARKLLQYQAEKQKRLILRNHVDTDELDADKSSMNEETFEVLIKEDTIDE